MPFTSIQGHASIIQRLKSAYRNNRIPSAYLCIGQNGVGRATTMKEFARFINCEDEDCQKNCPSCAMFNQDKHPDFYVIKPSGQGIRISQIHELSAHLSLKPTYAKKRVVIVNEAHKLNNESANSFLKLLEEPPLDTLIVLLAPDEHLLLETIVSRCQKLQFAPLLSSELSEVYSESFNVNENDLEFLLSYSQGRIRKDLLKKTPQLVSMRNQIARLLMNINDEEMVNICASLEQWVKSDSHLYFIEFISAIIRDMKRVSADCGDNLINRDISADISKLASQFPSDCLGWIFDLIVETESAIKANASRALALESLMIQIKQLMAGNYVV